MTICCGPCLMSLASGPILTLRKPAATGSNQARATPICYSHPYTTRLVAVCSISFAVVMTLVFAP